jgi:SIR2-like domain
MVSATRTIPRCSHHPWQPASSRARLRPPPRLVFLSPDLIKKLATAKGEPCDPSPEVWFHAAFGEAPSYSSLLKKVSRTPTERQRLLRSYFEPSQEEEASGQKLPTKAHRAIAALAKSGHIRVILTTNFDRLIERSLDAVGVSPIVISTPGAVDGAMPPTHAQCTVVKLHGDYLDARIKNTPDELAKYDRRIDRLLDRVFDEFGLIVSGWSADWDEALVRALLRCKSRRFTTYWTLRGKASDTAGRVIAQRAAERILTSGADEFFEQLRENLLSISSFDPPHPLSAKTAVATMKRYLVDERHRIDLHDLVSGEVERVMAATSNEKMPVSGGNDIATEARRRLGQFDASAARPNPARALAERMNARKIPYVNQWLAQLGRFRDALIIRGSQQVHELGSDRHPVWSSYPQRSTRFGPHQKTCASEDAVRVTDRDDVRQGARGCFSRAVVSEKLCSKRKAASGCRWSRPHQQRPTQHDAVTHSFDESWISRTRQDPDGAEGAARRIE